MLWIPFLLSLFGLSGCYLNITITAPPAQFSSITPILGSTIGGTQVTITGNNFTNDTKVALGGVECSDVQVISSTTLSCRTGTKTPSTIDSLVGIVLTKEYAETTSSSEAYTYVAPDISTHIFVDGNGANGLNKSTASGASLSMAVEHNSKLYAIWAEGSPGQIRVTVFNGNDDSPSWNFVDGNGANGINKDPNYFASEPILVVHSSKLYAVWRERNSSNILQIRVAVYNDNDALPTWIFVDGNGDDGLNKNTGVLAQNPQAVSFNSKLYLTWKEFAIPDQIRVVVYNGNDSSPSWSFVDGDGLYGLNKDTSKNASEPNFGVHNGKLYLTWSEQNAASVYNARVAVYNGNDIAPTWAFIDGNGANGLNKNTALSARIPSLTVFNSSLYMTWYEMNASSKNQIRVAVYNGNDSAPSWTFVDGNGSDGLNKNTAYDAVSPNLAVFNSKLYITWTESNSSGIYQMRFGLYNGQDSSPSWSYPVNTGADGLNKNINYINSVSKIAVFSSKLYLISNEKNSGGISQIRISLMK